MIDDDLAYGPVGIHGGASGIIISDHITVVVGYLQLLMKRIIKLIKMIPLI